MHILKEITEQYFANFPQNQRSMAASPVSLQYCLNLLDQIKPGAILDAGSGLSSLTFHSVYNDVVTIDDNNEWAMQTEQIVAEILDKRIKINNINSIVAQHFDFIFYDYGDIETRIYYYRLALHLCKNVMYIDDMHINFYREYVLSRSKQFELISLEKETKDAFGRYGYLLLKNNSNINEYPC